MSAPSRLVFDVVPEEGIPEKARRVLDASFRALRSVLEGGWRWREQTRCIDVVVDMAALPTVIQVRDLKARPTSVVAVSITNQRSTTGLVLSGGTVVWEWRAGSLLIHGLAAELDATRRYDVVLAVME